MKVKIQLSDEVIEPYVVIYASEATAEIKQLATRIECNSANDSLVVIENERYFVLRPEEIYMIRVEEEKTTVYSKEKKYTCGKRLYELENQLGNRFIRISKSALVNFNHLDYVEPSFGGVMLLVLKNGSKDYISRKYLPAFKKYLGM